MMIGGEPAVEAPRPDLRDSGARHAATFRGRRPRSNSTAPRNRAICIAARIGAGHFVKMVHNGIEYGMMAAYAEGLSVLQGRQHRQASRQGGRRNHAPARSRALPVRFQLCRCGRGVAARQRHLLLAAGSHRRRAWSKDPDLSKFAGRVSDSGEGRWTIKAAIDEGVPTPVLTASLYERFSSRGEADFRTSCSPRCATASAGTWRSPEERGCARMRPAPAGLIAQSSGY